MSTEQQRARDAARDYFSMDDEDGELLSVVIASHTRAEVALALEEAALDVEALAQEVVDLAGDSLSSNQLAAGGGVMASAVRIRALAAKRQETTDE